MASRVIDAVLRLRDEFTQPLGKSIKLMTSAGREGERTRKAIDRMGKSITGVGKEMTKSLTVPLVGAATAAVTTAANFEQAMSQVAASMGTTADRIPEIAEKAKELGATTSFTAVQAAEGFNILAQAGLSARDQIAALPSILDLAAAGSLDMASAASYVTGAVMGFGDTMENSVKYADMIAKGATQAKTDVNMLGTAFSDASSIAKTYGQSADTTMVTLLRLAQANVTGAEAATSYQRVLSRLYAPTDKASDALKSLGVSAYTSEGKARDFTEVIKDFQGALSGMSEEEANAYQKTILGQQGMAAFAKIAATSTEDVQGFYAAMSGSGGAASQQAATMLDNLKGQLTLLSSAVEGVAIAFGDKLLPYVKKAVEWVQGLADKVNGLSDEQMDMVVKAGAVVAALGPAVMLFGKMVSGAAKVSKGLSVLRGAFAAVARSGGVLKALLAALSAPAGIAVAAVAAIAGILAVVVTHFDMFKEAAKDVWAQVSPALENLKNAFGALWDVLGPVIGKASDLIANVLVKAFRAAGPVIAGIVNGIAAVIRKLAEILPKVIESGKAFAEKFGAAVSGVAAKLAPHIEGLMAAFNNLKNAVVPVIEAIIQKLSAIWTQAQPYIQMAADLISTVFAGAFETAKSVVTGAIGTIIDSVGNTIDMISGVIRTITAIIHGDWSAAWEAAGGVVKSVIDRISGILSGAVNTIRTIGDAVGGVVSKVKGVLGGGKVGENASGTANWRGGLTTVNERGGEIIDLPSGTRIYPHDESVAMARAEGAAGGGSVTIAKLADSIIVREDADIDRIADAIARKLQKANERRGGYSYRANMA